MKVIVSLDNPNHAGWLKLEESLKRHGWDYVTIVKEWKGFGTKIIGLYEYLVNDYDDDFIYLDAYDNYCIAPPDEFNYKHRGGTGLIISSEKGCYPDIKNIGKFPKVPHEWKYLNSGQIYGRREDFMKLYEDNPVRFEDDDQRWYTDRFLERRSSISLDYCNIFQSVAFEVEGDFTLTYNRLYNNKTHTFPMFIHGNGKTDMTKFYAL
ncbi:hypothetical protein UFOVP321_22 [uncultured Caudovirales phage]|uniref:PLOD1-3-like GT domain-containing protein n=1 Tax=uncultured Caudovirales phage TaxID=2100421 RepID=A0A6J5LSB5_9CAUD|nr:hypothetical protein UFOVP321_22 [uncultured Caudovirales phage]